MTYTLEVVRFIVDEKEALEKRGSEEHIGYMRAKFRTKEAACAYYDMHNKHMRSLKAHGSWSSDWDPETNLFYIVRRDHGLISNVAPFDKKDEPIDIHFQDGRIYQEYKFLCEE